jgi:hypothetical protein
MEERLPVAVHLVLDHCMLNAALARMPKTRWFAVELDE